MPQESFDHVSVLFDETLDGLAIKPGGTYVASGMLMQGSLVEI